MGFGRKVVTGPQVINTLPSSAPAVAANETVRAAFDPAFPSAEDAIALAGNGPAGDGGKIKITFWDPKTLRIIAHGNHLFAGLSKNPDGTSSVSYTGRVAPVGAVQTGALITVHPRLGIAHGTGVPAGLTYMITNSTRILTQDLVVHGGATESVVEGGGEGNNTYLRVKVIRRRPEQSPVRLLAANADGFHSSCVRVGPTLLDSEFEFTGDDILNIHSRMSLVLNATSLHSALIIDTLGSSSPADYDRSTLMLEHTLVGDSIAFFTLGSLKPLGTGNVTRLDRVVNRTILREAESALAAIDEPPYNQHITHPFGTRVWEVSWTTDNLSPEQKMEQFTIVDVPRLRNTGAVLQGNHFHDAYMRFGLFDSPGMSVSENRFERAFPAYIGESGDSWLEGPPVTARVSFENNTFSDVFGEYAVVLNPGADRGTTKVGKSNVCTLGNGQLIPCTALSVPAAGIGGSWGAQNAKSDGPSRSRPKP